MTTAIQHSKLPGTHTLRTICHQCQRRRAHVFPHIVMIRGQAITRWAGDGIKRSPGRITHGKRNVVRRPEVNGIFTADPKSLRRESRRGWVAE